MHLKVIQEMAKVPRGPGIPPLNDAGFSEALIVGSSNAAAAATATTTNTVGSGSGSHRINSPLPLLPMSDDDPRINPLAGLGLSDEQYAQILQTMMHSASISGYDDGSGSGSRNADDGNRGGEGGGNGLGKRALEDPEGDPREEKRSRFQVVE